MTTEHMSSVRHPRLRRRAFAFDGIFDGGMTYILFWTLVFNIVHLF